MGFRVFFLGISLFFSYSSAWADNVAAEAQSTCAENLQNSENSEWENKVVVIDTNVLLFDPEAIFQFPGAEVIIPMIVLEELDKFKNERGDRADLGRNSREFSRIVDDLRQEKGPLKDGLVLDNGSTLRFFAEKPTAELPGSFAGKVADNEILQVTKQFADKEAAKTDNSKEVVVISQDINLLIKADVLGFSAESYYNRSNVDSLYTGISELEISADALNLFRQNKHLEMDQLELSELETDQLRTEESKFHPNEYFILKSGPEKDAPFEIAKYLEKTNTLVKLTDLAQFNLPIEPRNIEQQIYLDMLLDDRIDLVTVNGKAGTGKTLLAITVAMIKTILTDNPQYDEILITRAIVPTGVDPGALPGDADDKHRLFMQPFYDNIEQIYKFIQKTGWKPNLSKKSAEYQVDQFEQRKERQQQNKRRRRGDNNPDEEALTSSENSLGFGIPSSHKAAIASDGLSISPVAYIRGRSLERKILIVDEAQNLSPHEVKTIVTRAGKNTKVIFIGDLGQIDTPYLNARSSGLTQMIELFKDESVAAHVTLVKGERSRLSEIATKVFAKIKSFLGK